MLTLLLATAALAAQNVQIKAADGTAIAASTEVVKGSKKGVVLVHMEGRTAEDWTYLADRLAKSQLTTVAPNLRGHGGSGGAADAFPAMVGDVQASIAWLHKQGVAEVSCVGASVGANLCVQAAAADPSVVNVVMLSPGLNIKGVTSSDAMPRYGDRPLLVVAASGDAASTSAAKVLQGVAQGQKHVEILQGTAKGTRMLNENANLEGLIQSWLLGTFSLSSGEIVTPKPGSAAPGTVETTGEKLPSHQ